MHTENVNPKFLKPPEFPGRSPTVVVKGTHSTNGYNGSSCGPGHALRTEYRVGTDDRADSPLQTFQRANPDSEKLFALYTAELLSLLRYTRFLSYPVVERWSRKLREIELTQPIRGIAVLDQLISDYWSVFFSCNPLLQKTSEEDPMLPEFEHEMRQMKARIDRLGAILVSVENRSEEVNYWRQRTA